MDSQSLFLIVKSLGEDFFIVFYNYVCCPVITLLVYRKVFHFKIRS